MFVVYPVLVMIDKPRGMIATASFGICQASLRWPDAAVSPPRECGVAITSVLKTRGSMVTNLKGHYVKN